MAEFSTEDPVEEAKLVEALWTEKDAADCQKWRDAKEADWAAKGKLLEKYPERSDFDAWLDKQCQKTKDAALTVRSNPKCFFDIAIGDNKPGRIIMQIRKDVVPKTADNFIQLCTGQAGYGYKGCPFHRVIPGFMCQGGVAGWAATNAGSRRRRGPDVDGSWTQAGRQQKRGRVDAAASTWMVRSRALSRWSAPHGRSTSWPRRRGDRAPKHVSTWINSGENDQTLRKIYISRSPRPSTS